MIGVKRVMVNFRDIPIRQKVMLLIIVTTSASLLLSGLGIVSLDTLLFRSYLERDLATFAHIIADNSTASLAFEDPESASEMLGTLRTRTHIAAACLYRDNGTVLARYERSGGESCPPIAAGDHVQATLRGITVSRSVTLQNRRVGTLVVLYDLGEMGERIRLYGFMVLAVLLVASLFVLLLSRRLSTAVTAPILELARTTGLVSSTKDYSIRAVKRSNDEVGDLVSTINEMLAGIQSRDTELRTSLEKREEALTRLAHVNKELRRSNEGLARSNEDLERFAFIASHDLQEPLRMVTLYSQLLVRKHGAVDEESASYLDYIMGGTRRMHELLADLLGYVEIAAAPGRPTQPVSLNTVLRNVKENVRMSIEETGAVITAGDLPTLQAHESHLISLFQNLIGNSIKYRGAQPPRINISVIDLGDRYQFAVADNGIGISPEYHARIFLAFKRLHGKSLPGTGIGLAICQRVVERYGGRIWIESEAGAGATFLFTFPKPAPEE